LCFELDLKEEDEEEEEGGKTEFKYSDQPAKAAAIEEGGEAADEELEDETKGNWGTRKRRPKENWRTRNQE
jgi:hypothetical protein